MKATLAGALALAVLPLVSGCGGSAIEDYCDAVQEHQKELTEQVANGGPAALIDTLDTFRDLEEKAPRDIKDEWQLVIRRIEVLQQALEAADVDPSDYDRNNPPAGLSPQEQAGIDAAAQELGSQATLDAFAGLQQQALDVCQTALSL